MATSDRKAAAAWKDENNLPDQGPRSLAQRQVGGRVAKVEDKIVLSDDADLPDGELVALARIWRGAADDCLQGP